MAVSTGSTIGSWISSGNCVAISDYLNCIGLMDYLFSFSSILISIYSFAVLLFSVQNCLAPRLTGIESNVSVVDVVFKEI